MELRSKFIKHEKNTDLCYKVINDDGDNYLLDIWNQGQSAAYPIGETCLVPKNKIDNQWLVCQNDYDILSSDRSFREATWNPLKIS